MNSSQYIEAKLTAGRQLHLHDGIWWDTSRWGYCKPAIPFEPVPIYARPAISKSAIGYGHRCLDQENASGYWNAIIMKGSDISTWSLTDSVDGKRRNLIRKGLRYNDIRRIDDLDPHQADFVDVSISTAIRNRRGYPPAYYLEKRQEWWNSILAVAIYSEFWGAFIGNKLVAYFCVHFAGHRVIIDAAKSNTEYLYTCPNDALVFTLLESSKQRDNIDEIWYGHLSADKPSLNQFKKSFGFKEYRIPYRRMALAGLVQIPRWLGSRIGAI